MGFSYSFAFAGEVKLNSKPLRRGGVTSDRHHSSIYLINALSHAILLNSVHLFVMLVQADLFKVLINTIFGRFRQILVGINVVVLPVLPFVHVLH